MSSRNLLFRNIKSQARINTGTIPDRANHTEAIAKIVKKGNTNKPLKDTGSTIDDIDQSLKENVSFQESNYNPEKNTLVDETIVDDNSQDTPEIKDDEIIE